MHGAKLRVGERAEQRQHAAERPDEKRQPRIEPALSQHHAGYEEDPRPDHRADGEEHQVREAQRSAKARNAGTRARRLGHAPARVSAAEARRADSASTSAPTKIASSATSNAGECAGMTGSPSRLAPILRKQPRFA